MVVLVGEAEEACDWVPEGDCAGVIGGATGGVITQRYWQPPLFRKHGFLLESSELVGVTGEYKRIKM